MKRQWAVNGKPLEIVLRPCVFVAHRIYEHCAIHISSRITDVVFGSVQGCLSCFVERHYTERSWTAMHAGQHSFHSADSFYSRISALPLCTGAFNDLICIVHQRSVTLQVHCCCATIPLDADGRDLARDCEYDGRCTSNCFDSIIERSKLILIVYSKYTGKCVSKMDKYLTVCDTLRIWILKTAQAEIY